MLKYKLVKETDNRITYEYYPEGNIGDKGVVYVDKADGNVEIVSLAPSDKLKTYAIMMLNRLRRFFSSGKYDDDGMVAWY